MDKTSRILEQPPMAPPIGALPLGLQQLTIEMTKAYNCPAEAVLLYILTISGALIGWTHQLQIKPGWMEHAAIYAGLVAGTGEGKSPPLDFLMEPIENLEASFYRDYLRQKKDFEAREIKSSPPIRKRLKIGDTTIEKVAECLRDNPRGLLWAKDELKGLISDMGRYSASVDSTKTKLIEAADLRSWQVDRKTQPSFYIRHACLGIIGTIQPEILLQTFSDVDAASGFLPRFLLVYVTQTTPPKWSSDTVSDVSASLWRKTVDRLAGLTLQEDPDTDGEYQSAVVSVTPEALDLYIAWSDRITAEAWTIAEVTWLKAITSKIKAQALRIALILHILGSEEELPSSHSVDATTMQSAIDIADWFYTHQKRIWSLLRSKALSEHTPREMRVATAVVGLEAEIRNGCLSTARITQAVNDGHAEEFKLSCKAVGRILRQKLKLPSARNKDARGVEITPQTIRRLRNLYCIPETSQTSPTSQTQQPCALQGNDIRSTSVTNVTNDTNVTNVIGDISDISKNNDIAVDAHKHRGSAINDVSDIKKTKNMSEESGWIQQSKNIPLPDEVEEL